jgi:nucleotide-binding universal stress UspA family protein
VPPLRSEAAGKAAPAQAVQAEERLLGDTLDGRQQRRPDVVVREVIARGRAARSLLAAGLTAELLVIGQRRRGPLATPRSTTRAVLRPATGPVAVAPIEPGPHG